MIFILSQLLCYNFSPINTNDIYTYSVFLLNKYYRTAYHQRCLIYIRINDTLEQFVGKSETDVFSVSLAIFPYFIKKRGGLAV